MDFVDITSDDPNFGGYLITPESSRVVLVFEINLWRVPLWSPPIHTLDGHTMSPVCSTQDLKTVSTIKNIIGTIHHDDFLYPLGVDQGL